MNSGWVSEPSGPIVNWTWLRIPFIYLFIYLLTYLLTYLVGWLVACFYSHIPSFRVLGLYSPILITRFIQGIPGKKA